MKLRSFALAWHASILPAVLMAASPSPTTSSPAIPWEQLGAEAQKQYSGGGLAIKPTPEGARLQAMFQDLEARATPEGLWLESTAEEDAGKPSRFRVRATALGRQAGSGIFTRLADHGKVHATSEAVAFVRPGLVEEYTVSTDGVRQDFVVMERPAGEGALYVTLEVRGARIEASTYGAKFILEGSGREIAYSRLKVIDATGRELDARMEQSANNGLSLVVRDTGAAYPIRIDPTFSDADWVSMGGVRGTDGVVYSMVVDGSGNMYIGGSFSIVGNAVANCLAKWNGSVWSALGSGMDESVYALAMSGNDLYAGGDFSTAGGVAANRIAKWNGSAWSALGSGVNNTVWALVVSGPHLYVGGDFSMADDISFSRIAKWNGSAWSALGSGMDNSVYALAASGTDIYAGGTFRSAGGISANRIAKWNGSAWSFLSNGIGSGEVRAIAVSGTELYAGGQFSGAGSVSASRIAKWNGSTWSALGFGMDGMVYSLAISGTDLYAGGQFTGAGSASANYIAKWNGSTWSALGSGMNFGIVYSVAVSGTDVYAGGYFGKAGGATAASIAKWNGSAWSALGSGMDSSVQALTMLGTDLYAGGSFTTAGGVNANYIAKWNGSAWSALGSGVNNSVVALAVSGTDLYAAGNFSTAGGISANHIAKWNGSAWSALGSGTDNVIRAIAVSGTNIYAGGAFTAAGGAGANYIAKWNGSTWSTLGLGTNAQVKSLLISGTNLFAGGDFIAAGGVSTNYIAMWNGSAWSGLGAGPNGGISAMAMIGTDLYVGGLFETANGLAANNIAKWNGSAWSALGSGMNSSVVALAVSSTDLYAGGEFTTAGGVSASRIAKWNGSAWSALGSGVNNSVLALAVSGTDLFASGLFATAGGKVSGYVALARLAAVAPDIAVEQPLSTNLTDGTASVAFGSLALGTSGTAKTFTLRNTGTADLTGLVVNKDGTNSADFSVNSSGMTAVTPAGTTAFTVTFSPGGTISAVRMAALHIVSNDPDENPFDIALTGTGLSTTTDMDGDGLSDWAEGQYATLGFDWQVNQTALVSTLNSGANAANLYTQTQYNTNFITGRTTGQNDVINAPNPYGLYTPTQVQALNVGTPLIQRNATTGEFTLTIGVEKSTNLNTFTPFLMTAPQTLINAEGKLEFRFTVPDNAAFFQLRVR